ncbi:MAG TPA: helix-turn-helix transcriptional regulator [Micromonosporaceae bacterium]
MNGDQSSGDETSNRSDPRLSVGPYPVAGLVRRARQIAGLSQRELARRAGISPSTVGKVEAGTIMPTLPALQRMLDVAELLLVVVDRDGRVVVPADDGLRDLGGRHYPAHLEVLRDPVHPDWWYDRYGPYWMGEQRPAATYHLNRPRPDSAQSCLGGEGGAVEGRVGGEGSAVEGRVGEAGGPPYGDWPIGFRRRRKTRRGFTR